MTKESSKILGFFEIVANWQNILIKCLINLTTILLHKIQANFEGILENSNV